VLQPLGAHRFGEPEYFELNYVERRLRCDVARAEAGAARRHD
jgi:hypothetical protein